MLTIRTYLDKSPIEGVGVFTRELVKKGTLVWGDHPLIDFELSREQVESLPDAARDFVESVAVPYPIGADNFWLSLDNGNYMNHSETPNVDAHGYAVMDIPEGTELTCDYYKLDHRTKELGL